MHRSPGRPTADAGPQRGFLAETLDSERLTADYRDGVLTLRVPVKEQAKPRRVTVSSTAASPTAIDTNAAEEQREAAGASA